MYQNKQAPKWDAGDALRRIKKASPWLAIALIRLFTPEQWQAINSGEVFEEFRRRVVREGAIYAPRHPRRYSVDGRRCGEHYAVQSGIAELVEEFPSRERLADCLYDGRGVPLSCKRPPHASCGLATRRGDCTGARSAKLPNLSTNARRMTCSARSQTDRGTSTEGSR